MIGNKNVVNYKCLLCGRDKFTRKSPHNCNNGFRKRKIQWIEIPTYRPKQKADTLCNYTVSGKNIFEGHILGYGDNYPCVVLYNPFEAEFQAIEFGYKKDGYLIQIYVN